MKVKEIDRTANIAWSPASHHPIYLAAGTAAQQLDATFSTTAALEIYGLNLTEPGLDMCMKGSVVSDFRFHKIVWGCEGMKQSNSSSGVIVGGADGGNIMIYDAANIIKGDSALVHHTTKHTGPVHSLDFNKFQDCLLASGASESEIFIWDLNNPTAPVTLGAKSQPLEDVTCVSWNCQVQHILASTFPARCVVWDLRKNEPIIKVSDSSLRQRCKVVAWHPEVATQLCLASEDDHSPVIQLWDLRFATSPLKTLEHHQRGVLSIAWCPQDPDLLLSCGKDNRILCWNPNSEVENGEVLCELPTGSQWSFDVAWCPRNPAVIANSSCDGHVSVFSLMGGQQQVHCSSKIAESFPGAEITMQPQHVESIHRNISVPLQKAPKWIRKPAGASFGFGGKLVYFGNESPSGNQTGEYQQPRVVHITQVVTEPELLKKSEKLESSLANGNLVEFCQNKIENSNNPQDKILWNFLQVTFTASPRSQMLTLLGYNYEKISEEIGHVLLNQGGRLLLENGNVAEELSNLSMNDSVPGDGSVTFDKIASNVKSSNETLYIHTNSDNDDEDSSIGEIDCFVSKALLTGNIPYAVELCIKEDRWADALVLAQAGGSQLLQKTQQLYFKSVDTNASKLISAVVTSDWLSMVKNCHISCWKEVLAAILTYSKPDDFVSLCDLLGKRLENNPHLNHNAALCYISSGNLDGLAQSWSKVNENLDVNNLQNVIEQIMILRRSVEHGSGSTPPLKSGVLPNLLGQYAELLATQGSLRSAATYLLDPNEQSLAVLQDRIYQALGHRSPSFPFQRVNVQRSRTLSQSSQSSQSAAPSFGHRNSIPLVQSQAQFAYNTPSHSIPSSTYHNVPSTGPQYQVQSTPHSVPSPPQPGTLAQPVAQAPPVDGFQSSKNRQNSGGSSHPLSQRYPRHLHDPSVYSENQYPQQSYYQPNFPVQSQPNAYQAQPTPTFYSPDSSASGSFSYAPSSSAPNPVTSAPYQSGPFNPISSAIPPMTSSNPTPPTMPQAPLPSCYNEVKPGWNDPPPVRSAQLKPATSTFENAAPITRPFPDMPAAEPMPTMPQSMPPGGYFTPGYVNQAPSPMINTMPMVPSSLAEEPKPAPAIVPEQPKEKGPIPPEHQVLQDIFEDLRRQCQKVATNPQTKRKLDDVAKKLENLYDKLRDNSLSGAITSGLHRLVQSVLQSDYMTALGIHGEIVSSANFSEISSFMPCLKVLLQTSATLNVYLQ